MTILAGKLSQNSGELSVNLLQNPLAALVFSIEPTLTQGEYIVEIDKPILNSDMPVKWYTANNEGNRYAISQNNSTTFSVQCFNADGTNATGDILSNCEFQIETY